MSFELLLQQARAEPNYDEMKRALSYIVETTNDTFYIAQFIQPFLAHINSDSLNVFHSSLYHSHNNTIVLHSMIHNVINDCKKNTHLYQFVQVLIEKYL
jgi:hypothetical protein